MRAAMQAPSAGNQQPWKFVVVRDKQILKSVPNFHPYAQMVPEAELAILVCGDTSKEKYKGYWLQDWSAATENMLIAIQAYGLGGVWLGIHPDEQRIQDMRIQDMRIQDMRIQDMRTLFHISESNVVPLALVPVGYAKHVRTTSQERYNHENIFLNIWGNAFDPMK